MPLRMTDIINMPELRTRFFAGDKGGGKIVRWAHVCELPDPTEWLGEGELLMTTGIGIPNHQKAQTAYINKLSQAGLAGLMIGENMQAPEDLSALKKAADRLNFPVLMTQYNVPFSSVTRAVIDAGRQEEFDRRNAITRLSVSARMAIEGLSLEQLLQRLEKDIHAKLMLLDSPEDNQLWFPKNTAIPESLREAIKRQPMDFSDTQPVARRYILGDGDVLAVSVPSRRGGILMIRHGKNHLLEYSLLYHLVAVLGISMERLHVETERSLRLGSQLLDDLLNLRLSPYELGKQLEQLKLNIKSACLAIARPVQQKLVEWGFHLSRFNLPVLLHPQGDELIILAHAKDISSIQAILNTSIGLSKEIGDYERLPEALREARLALVHTGECTVVSYTEIADKVPWLPDNLDEAARIFQKVLGLLEDHDQKQGTPLLHTLRCFLEQNRSWVLAAKQLHIHKTSLIYRIRKIESITGRSLDCTEDVVILWLALRSGEIAGISSSKMRRTTKAGDPVRQTKKELK
jgi:purine catabolism regulator